jgi:hypothetical protein
MNLSEIIPWGRTLAEYKLMFTLSDADLNSRILGCGDGPASFNAEMTELGYSVVSLGFALPSAIDPVYQFSAQQIEQRVRQTYETVIAQVRQNLQRYIWTYFANPDELGHARLAAMEKFLLDYEQGKIAGRYLDRSLPNLDLAKDLKFDLCVCSHLLFLYSEQLSLDFHLASIYELLKIASEVRIFPLLKLDCQPSPYLERVIQEFSSNGYNVEIQSVNYEFQQGGNRMLRISASELNQTALK